MFYNGILKKQDTFLRESLWLQCREWIEQNQYERQEYNIWLLDCPVEKELVPLTKAVM